MKYTLIFKNGKVMVFNVKECAELYHRIYGGTMIKDCELEASPVQ